MCTSQGCLDNDATVDEFGVPMYIPPLGPLPNGFYSDKDGKGHFETELSYCILDVQDDPTMFFSTAMHWYVWNRDDRFFKSRSFRLSYS